MTVAHAGAPPLAPWHAVDATGGSVAAPGVDVPGGPPPPAMPVHPAHGHVVAPPVPLQGDPRFQRPGSALPRGAGELTATHVVRRRDRGWVVSLVAAAVVLAAAAAVILAVGAGRAAAHQSGGAGVLRVTPDPAPAAGSAAPDRGTTPRPAPEPR